MSEWYLQHGARQILSDKDECLFSDKTIRHHGNHLLEYVLVKDTFYVQSSDGWKIIKLEESHPAWELV